MTANRGTTNSDRVHDEFLAAKVLVAAGCERSRLG